MSNETVNKSPSFKDRVIEARESFSGKSLTQSQFQEAWAISGIIHQEIQKNGSFRDPLTDYSHTYARTKKFDAMRGEAILRDIYTGRYGQSMNQTREALMDQEKALIASPEKQTETQAHALNAAESVESMIKEGSTQPFYKAYDTASVQLASDIKITQIGAKALMKDAYKNTHDRELYDHGKKVEEAYHKPVREAEIASRKVEKLETQSRTQNRSMA